MNFYLARQPIFDLNQTVIGYEIVYRNSVSTPGKTDTVYDDATSKMLLNGYLDIGMEALLDGHMAFINFNAELILKDSPLLLNSKTTTIQIASDNRPDDLFIEKIKLLKDNGYLISLSNYTLLCPNSELIDLCDIIQIRFNSNTTGTLSKIANRFKHTSTILLAKNIDTYEDYKAVKDMGFELFQGDYYSQPVITKGVHLSQSNYNNLKILELVNAEEPDIKLVAMLIEKDIHLTVKLLRLVNSSHYFNNKIQSVQHALAMIGIDSFRSFINLALLDSFLDDQTPEIIKSSMMRMKLIETISLKSSFKRYVNSLKLIGLLSVLDVLLHTTMLKAINTLPIERDLKLTLLGKETKYSSIYNLVLHYEKGDFYDAYKYAHNFDFNLDLLPDMYASSLIWADELFNQLYS